MNEAPVKEPEVKERQRTFAPPRPVQSKRHAVPKKRRSTYQEGVGQTVVVLFTAKDDGDYVMTFRGRQGSTLDFNKDEYPGMEKKDFFVIQFVLDDQTTAKDLEVPPNPMNAIWICTPRQVDPPVCPLSPVYDQQIYALRTDPGSRSLWVRNEDMQKERFEFTLRFLRRGEDPSLNSSYANYDPGGNNMNGGSGASD